MRRKMELLLKMLENPTADNLTVARFLANEVFAKLDEKAEKQRVRNRKARTNG